MLAPGMAIENIWLAATSLGIGMRFVPRPVEAGGEYRRECVVPIGPPEGCEVVAIFRRGYVDPSAKRPTIDWSSTQRKDVSTLCCDETFDRGFRPEGAGGNARTHNTHATSEAR